MKTVRTVASWKLKAGRRNVRKKTLYIHYTIYILPTT